jgi:deazaflavin-dependent oxidoreductase (nitroreductase family)
MSVPSSRANRVVAGLLTSRAHGVVSRAMCLLEVVGRNTGRTYRFPVQYAEADGRLVVWPGHPERKTWWHNLRTPAPVVVWLRGTPLSGQGVVVTPGDEGYPAAHAAYAHRFPRVGLPATDPLVSITVQPAPR